MAQAHRMRNIPALIGPGLALLGLLCLVTGTIRGANMFISLPGCLLALRLFILCIGSFHDSTKPVPVFQDSPNGIQNHAFMTPTSATEPPVFAASRSSMPDPSHAHATRNAASEMSPTTPIPHPPHPQRGQYLHDDIPTQPIASDASISHSTYVPIEQDELFQLDTPAMGEYILYLPKEGEALVECQDRFALNASRGRYAVADGVSGSFAPGPWARIIAQGFVGYGVGQETPGTQHVQDVERSGYFLGERSQFEQWLSRCRNTWYEWMRDRWVPTMNALRARRGDSPVNWDIDIEQGAQTTLVGCQLCLRADPSDPYIDVYVSVIGDSEFFLFRRNAQHQWQNVAALPFITADEFNTRPTVLATRPQSELVERAWTQHQEGQVAALPGDCIVLASDTLAKWILTQVQYGKKEWTLLLDNTDNTLHEQILRHELHENRMEDDDLTMLVIPIALPRRETR